MVKKTGGSDTPTGALSQLGALRDRLAAADPAFQEAARLELDAEAFCERVRADLKAHRKALKINQEELARRLDLSQSAISKAESGRGDLSLKTVFRIAAALGFNPVVAFASTSHAAGEAHAAAATDEQAATAAALVAVQVAVQEDLIRQIPEIVQDAVQGAVARLATTE